MKILRFSFITLCLINFSNSVISSEDLNLRILDPEFGQEQAEPEVNTTNENECYVDDPRLERLPEVLKSIKESKNKTKTIKPIKVKVETYLEFSSTYIEYIGRNNILIITEDCQTYPTELVDLPFKTEVSFDEVFNRLIEAIENDDKIKADFISRNIRSKPVDLNGAVKLLTKIEISKQLAEALPQYVSIKTVRDTTSPMKISKGNYKSYLILLDLFQATGGKLLGSEHHIGLAMLQGGAICRGMNSSHYYTQEGVVSTGWLPGYMHAEEPYNRSRTLLKIFGIEVSQIGCKEYLKMKG